MVLSKKVSLFGHPLIFHTLKIGHFPGGISIFDLQIIGIKIVEELGGLIDEEVVVIDHNGYIIASTDTRRIHHFHEGSLLAMEMKEIVHMTTHLSKTLKGVREGMVIPLIIDDSPIGVIGVTGQPSNIEKFCKLIQKITQLFVEDFFTRQEREREYRLLELFILDLLRGQVQEDVIRQRAAILKLDTSLTYCIAVLQIESRLEVEELDWLKSSQIIHPQLQAVQWSYDKVILLIPDTSRTTIEHGLTLLHQKIEKKYKTTVTIGVGHSLPFYELQRSFEMAMIALNVTTEFKSIVFEEHLKLELLLSDISEVKVQQYLKRTMAPILDQPELIRTLSVWLSSNDSLQQTADALFIHRNTLKYRLKKIEKLLHTDLHHTMNKLELLIAIQLFERQQAHLKETH